MGQAQSFTDQFVYHTEAGKATEGCTPVFRAASHPTELVETFLDREVHSSWDLFDNTVKRSPNRKFLGRRFRDERGQLGQYEWMTYSEACQIALAFGTVMRGTAETPGLVPLTEAEGLKMRILGMYAKNCVEWFLAEQGANAYGLTLCPLYDTLGDEAMEFILKQTEMSVCLVAFENLESLVRVLEGDKPGQVKPGMKLQRIVLINPCTPSNPAYVINLYRQPIEKAKELGLRVDLWHEIVSRCSRPGPVSPGGPEEVNTLCYTSGTTGMPKAVILPHKMVVAVVVGAARGPISPAGFFEVNASDSICSYLPLAHVFERCVCNIVISKGGGLAVYSGDMAKLLDDVKVLRPTVFVSVPRLFNRVNDKVALSLLEKNVPVQMMFSVGLNSKVNRRRSESSTQHKIWDSVVFGKIRDMMGGRLRGMISGGAPLDPIVNERMTAFFACPLMQGYGLSETFGPCFMMHPDDPSVGYIGGVWPSVEFKLSSVPELNYYVTEDPPAGELLLRGPGVTSGYFKNPEETQLSFDNDGWFHTGDIATMHPRTLAVKIIDRKKNIFKLCQGEYIAPEKIESVYNQALSVAQIFVYGDSMQQFLVAIVYPDIEGCKAFPKYTGKKNISEDLYSLCKDPQFKEFILQDLEQIAKKQNLKGFEKVKDFVLTPEPFTIENNLLTPTSKIKRVECKKVHQHLTHYSLTTHSLLTHYSLTTSTVRHIGLHRTVSYFVCVIFRDSFQMFQKDINRMYGLFD
ncbi:putative long-chain-fatty-acid-CoA ligase [Gregarina niphandrodes]|uniref:Long-chain-fatty-acid-CoA ligase n=1 Tax=Gregarina niphandrodes TaxID=110365 RepID=A0A023B3B3_GRENI|nr:putative long-chain-fatty-acid-CoA ligase [Gregarina niphandrodes]EZG55202.1 putative long-chain-fatty-acid-CoA ligase [Gregarina niphandrodes]|eukprot:XP_011131729.1 putative long-chain-fatty-acid-CoA ligase [Gregarina niphandrodes]